MIHFHSETQKLAYHEPDVWLLSCKSRILLAALKSPRANFASPKQIKF